MALKDILNGGIGGQVQEAAEVLGKSKESAAAKSFNRDFNISDFDSFGGDLQTDKFVEIGRFDVPAATEYSWGYGSAQNPENQGYLFFDLYNSTPSELEGTVRFSLESSTGRESEVVADYDTSRLDASKSDKQQMVPFPEQVAHPKVGQDQSLVIYMEGNTADTISNSDSTIIVPVTEYDLGTQR